MEGLGVSGRWKEGAGGQVGGARKAMGRTLVEGQASRASLEPTPLTAAGHTQPARCCGRVLGGVEVGGESKVGVGGRDGVEVLSVGRNKEAATARGFARGGEMAIVEFLLGGGREHGEGDDGGRWERRGGSHAQLAHGFGGQFRRRILWGGGGLSALGGLLDEREEGLAAHVRLQGRWDVDAGGGLVVLHEAAEEALDGA
mmetsp:Transcript_22952/g.39358  ORF Transcript_22952/g.39358 Transcript_22952/m.39358 type:complete len:200 (-) Transcript_22952:1235-1834(-)